MRHAFLLACLVLPWISPFAPGPSPNVVPWLLSATFAALAWLLPGAPLPRRLLPAAAALAALVLFARPTGSLEALALAGGCLLVAFGFQLARAPALGGKSPALVAGAWLLAALLSALAGLLQYFDLAATLQPWVQPGTPGLAFSNLRQRNQLASLCALGLAALLWYGGRPGARGPLLAAAAVLLGLANAATASRTGLLQWLMLPALVLLWGGPARRSRLALCAAAIAGYVLGALLLPAALEALTGLQAVSALQRLGEENGCSSRSVLWSNVLQLVARHPWMGWGWGELDYAHYATLYEGARFCDVLDNAHNLPLHLAVELGVPFAAVVCGWAAWAVLRRRPWREGDPQRQLAWSALAVLAVHSLLEYPLWYGPFQLAAGLALGLLAQPATQPPRRAGRVAVAISVPWFALLAYAGWDYLRVAQVYLPPPQRLTVWRDDALAQARGSWLFANQARFAELTISPVTDANAREMAAMAEAALHYSPEPRVIEQAIEAATRLERRDKAAQHLARYRAAFPADYAAWRERLRLPPREPGAGS